MNKLLLLISGLFLLSNCTPNGGSSVKMDGSVKDSISYALGVDMATRMTQAGFEDVEGIKGDLIAQGIKDVFDKKESISQEVVAKYLNDFRQELTAAQNAQRDADGQVNADEGIAFLDANKTKDGVKVTESGLQYKVLEAGSGKSPKATDQVKVHYEGRLISGKVFDSSYQRGQPATFGLNQVIPGWTEGVQLMKEGAKYEFYIPSDLAYGPRGAGQDIGPNSTLIFTVELIAVNP